MLFCLFFAIKVLFCVDYIQLFYALSGFVFEQGSMPLVNLSFINRLYMVNSGFSLIQKPWHQDITPWKQNLQVLIVAINFKNMYVFQT